MSRPCRWAWWVTATLWGVSVPGLADEALPPGAAASDVADDVADDEAPNPWRDGPDAPAPDPLQDEGAPPTEGAPRGFGLQAPPRPPEPPRPFLEPAATLERREPYGTMTLRASDLIAAAPLNLTEAMAFAPGIWFSKSQTRSPMPAMRGGDGRGVAVRLDGVPLLSADTFPGFSTLGMVALDEIQAVHVRGGPQVELGVDRSTTGLIDIDTLGAPQDLGEDGRFSGQVRGGFGGPDLEKAVFASGAAGWGRARLRVYGGAFHHDEIRGARDEGVRPDTEALGGYLGAAADVLVYKNLRLFASWHSQRQARLPLPDRCVRDGDDRRADCLVLTDRARDTAIVGADAGASALGFSGGLKVRAHAQRYAEEWTRNGVGLRTTERTDTTLWRAGGIADAWVRTPSVRVVDRFALKLRLGGELLRDAVDSTYGSRSRRSSDAVAPGNFIDDPALAPFAPRSDALTYRGQVGLDLEGEVLTLGATLQGSFQRLGAEPGLTRLETSPLAQRDVTWSAQAYAAVVPVSGVTLFVRGTRATLPDSLWSRTAGPLRIGENAPFAATAPSRRGQGAALVHTVDVGADAAYRWVNVSAVLYGGERSAPLSPGIDVREAEEAGAPVRWVRGERQQFAGVEGRAQVVTGLDGLTANGSVGAVMVDDGVFFRKERFTDTQPATGTARPSGALGVRYASITWPFSVFARVRYALPLARLSPDEEADTTLCPEGIAGLPDPVCRGALGHGTLDMGAGFYPSRYFRVDGVVTNLVDAPWGTRGSALQEGGLGARLVGTVTY